MKGSDSRLTPPSSRTKGSSDSSSSAPLGWLGWLFGSCTAGGSALYSLLPTSLPERKTMSIDDTIRANNAYMVNIDQDRQLNIQVAADIKASSLAQLARSKDLKIDSASRAAAAENANQFARRYNAVMTKVANLKTQFANLEDANRALESNRGNEEYIHAMQTNASVLRKASAQSGINVESVGETMDAFHDQLSEIQTVNREMSRSIVNTPDSIEFDDQDAKNLLSEWLGELDVEEIDIANAPRVPIDTIPSSQPTIQYNQPNNSRRIQRDFEKKPTATEK